MPRGIYVLAFSGSFYDLFEMPISQARSEYIKTPDQFQKAYERTKRWQKANPEKVKEQQKRTRDKNREKRNAYNREYKKRNKEKLREYARSYQRKWMGDKSRTDPAFAMLQRLRHRLQLCLKVKFIRKTHRTIELLGCDIHHFKSWIESQFTEGMSWENRRDWHLDHIYPCSKFDMHNEQHRTACFHYTNIQPLWKKDNFSKSNLIPDKIPEIVRAALGLAGCINHPAVPELRMLDEAALCEMRQNSAFQHQTKTI